jgi:hypothetical protein
VDLAREPGDLLGQVLVLLRERRVRVEQAFELGGLGSQRGDALGGPALGVLVSTLGLFDREFAARRRPPGSRTRG